MRKNFTGTMYFCYNCEKTLNRGLKQNSIHETSFRAWDNGDACALVPSDHRFGLHAWRYWMEPGTADDDDHDTRYLRHLRPPYAVDNRRQLPAGADELQRPVQRFAGRYWELWCMWQCLSGRSVVQQRPVYLQGREDGVQRALL